jgi:hypothetical protein
MSRKDFELLAAVIALEWSLTADMRLGAREVGVRLRALERLTLAMADSLEASYPRFDRDRFLVAALPVLRD